MGKALPKPEFEPSDFFTFEEEDIHYKIDYIKGNLHPRLKAMGEAIRIAFLECKGIELRSQLRSGRWFKMPLWTNVSLIASEETKRSDSRRPRLSIRIDENGVIAGFFLTIWSPEWKKVREEERQLIEVIDSTAKAGKLQIGILNWTQEGKRILTFPNARDAIAKATKLRQDFAFVGRYYHFPNERELLYSPLFLSSAQEAIFLAWPVYEFVFFLLMTQM
jgi:hypothetical protein